MLGGDVDSIEDLVARTPAEHAEPGGLEGELQVCTGLGQFRDDGARAGEFLPLAGHHHRIVGARRLDVVRRGVAEHADHPRGFAVVAALDDRAAGLDPDVTARGRQRPELGLVVGRVAAEVREHARAEPFAVVGMDAIHRQLDRFVARAAAQADDAAERG